MLKEQLSEATAEKEAALLLIKEAQAKYEKEINEVK